MQSGSCTFVRWKASRRQRLGVKYRWNLIQTLRLTTEVERRTVIDIKNQQLLPLAKRVDDVDLKVRSRFFDLANVSLVVLVGLTSSRILRKVDIEIVDNIRKELQLYHDISPAHRDYQSMTNLKDP